MREIRISGTNSNHIYLPIMYTYAEEFNLIPVGTSFYDYLDVVVAKTDANTFQFPCVSQF